MENHRTDSIPNDSYPVKSDRLLGHPQSPLKAIRAKCVDCSGGSVAEARRCAITHCVLWAFRMGHNPFYGKSQSGPANDIKDDI
jgi:hypothetical protein